MLRRTERIYPVSTHTDDLRRTADRILRAATDLDIAETVDNPVLAHTIRTNAHDALRTALDTIGGDDLRYVCATYIDAVDGPADIELPDYVPTAIAHAANMRADMMREEMIRADRSGFGYVWGEDARPRGDR
jgi:hypothetical protein